MNDLRDLNNEFESTYRTIKLLEKILKEQIAMLVKLDVKITNIVEDYGYDATTIPKKTNP